MQSQRLWVGIVVTVFLLYFLSHMLIPFFIAALIAYLGDPLVDRLARWHLPRTVGVIVVFVIVVVIIALLLFFLIPLLGKQLGILLQSIPLWVNAMDQKLSPWLSRFIQIKDFQSAIDFSAWQSMASANIAKAGWVVQWIVGTITSSGVFLINLLMDCVIIIAVSFYLMRDWQRLYRAIQSLIPRSKVDKVTQLATQCNEVLSAFLRGQLLIMIVLGVIYSVGLMLVGVKIALVIGIIAGLISVVPCLGTLTGLVVAIIAATVQFGSFIPVAWVLIVFIIGNIIENMVLTPWLIGDRIGLHPVAVIFSVLAGGVLFGFFGVLLALPVAALLMVFVRYYQQCYLVSDLYREKTSHS